MKISIAIPCHNRIDLLKETLVSLNKQSFKDFEVIISDDSDILENRTFIKNLCNYSDLNIKYIYTDFNLGQSKNSNQALKNCSGEYIRILHSDDILHPNTIEEEFNIINNYDINVLFHYIIPFNDYNSIKFNYDKHFINLIDPKFLLKTSLNVRTPIPSSFCFKRNMLDDVGYMNQDLKFLCDWDLFFRLNLNCIKNKKFIIAITKKYVYWRQHNDSTTCKYYKEHYSEHLNFINFIIKTNILSKYLNLEEHEIKSWENDAEIYRNIRYKEDSQKYVNN